MSTKHSDIGSGGFRNRETESSAASQEAGNEGSYGNEDGIDGEAECLPLLVRKLSVFRKGLVHERNLRTQAESTIDRLRQKLKNLQDLLAEKESSAIKFYKRAQVLEERVQRSSEQRKNEKRLDKIFSTFGTKTSLEKENKKLRQYIEKLRRSRVLSSQRIEELEGEIRDMHMAGNTHMEVFKRQISAVEQQVAAKDSELSAAKIAHSRLSNTVEELRVENEVLKQELKTRKENCDTPPDSLIKDLHTSLPNATAEAKQSPDSGEKMSEVSARERLRQAQAKSEILQNQLVQLNDFWMMAQTYDTLVRKFDLFKLRKVLPRRNASIVLEQRIHSSEGPVLLVTRSGETFVHPCSTIRKINLLPSEQGSRFALDSERAFSIEYSDTSKTDTFEGSCWQEVLDCLRRVLAKS